MPERVAPGHLDATSLKHKHAGRDFSRHEQRLALVIMPLVPEATKPIDFRRREFRKHPLIARIDPRHHTSSWVYLTSSIARGRSARRAIAFWVGGGNA